MKTSRQLVSESKVTILMPADWAASRSAQMACGSFAARTIAPAPFWIAVWMNGDCEVGEASLAPASVNRWALLGFTPPSTWMSSWKGGFRD